MIIVPIKEGENIEQTERGVIPYSLSDSYIIPAESIPSCRFFYARRCHLTFGTCRSVHKCLTAEY